MIIEQLNKEFEKLNLEYLELDSSLHTANENDSFLISEKMENIQHKMSKIATALENN